MADIKKAFDTFNDEFAKQLQESLAIPVEHIRDERLKKIHDTHYEKTGILLNDLRDLISELELFKDWQYLSLIIERMNVDSSSLLTQDEMKKMNEIYKRWKHKIDLHPKRKTA
jgi:hypothetical protein